jgi:hypothetical protein
MNHPATTANVDDTDQEARRASEGQKSLAGASDFPSVPYATLWFIPLLPSPILQLARERSTP